MKKFQSIVVSIAIVIGAIALPVQTVGAVNVFGGCSGSSSTVCKDTSNSGNAMIKNVVNLLLYALGVIAVIMIVIGGIRYATSDGDSAKLKSARDTILYSVVGLVIGLLAYTIVNFVIDWF